MKAITTTTTLWEILNKSKIVVPTFQRDYAQGRAGKEDLRKKFLKEIRKSLDDNSELLLDFVYGTKKDDIIYPLDGQQRLTTLWVLMWYATFIQLTNIKSSESKEKELGELENRKVVLQKFTYETRTSSKDFIEWLCGEFLTSPKEYKKQKSNNTDLSLSDFIQRQTGFYSGWKQDPTIQSVLRMLSGTQVVNKKTKKIETPHKDGIEQIFKGIKIENFDKLFEFSNKCPIKFYHLNLLGFKQPDNLYVKMNARGEQLTSFENFKADLIGECRKNNDLKKYVEYNKYNNESYILTKWDKDWTQIFWEHREKKDSIDDLFFAFIKRFLLNRYVEKNVSTLQLQPIEVLDKEYSLKLDDDYDTILFDLPEGVNLSSVCCKLNKSEEGKGNLNLELKKLTSGTYSIKISEKGKSFQKGVYTIIFHWDPVDLLSSSRSKNLKIKPKKKNGEEDPIVQLLYTNEQKEYTSYELYQTLIDQDCIDDLKDVLDCSLSEIKKVVKDIPLLRDENYSFIPQYAKDKNGTVLDLVKSASFAERIMMYGICRYLLIIKPTQQGQKISVKTDGFQHWLRVLANLVYYNEIPNYAAYESRLKFIKGVIDKLGDNIRDIYSNEAISILNEIAGNKEDNDSIQLKEEIKKINLINTKNIEQIIKNLESLWIFSGRIDCLLPSEEDIEGQTIQLHDGLCELLKGIIGNKRTYIKDDERLLSLFRATLAKADKTPDELVFNDDHNNLRKLLNEDDKLKKPFLEVVKSVNDAVPRNGILDQIIETKLLEIIAVYKYNKDDWKYALVKDKNLWQYATQGKCVKNGEEYFWYRGTYKNKADIPLKAYSKFICDNGIPTSITYIEKDGYWQLAYDNNQLTMEFGKEDNQN